MELRFDGKVVAITGGTSGIGEAVGLAFAESGAKIAICGRSQNKIDAAAAKFKEAGFDVYTESVDVSSIEALDRFAENVYNHYGRLDIWINNAGSNIHKPSEDITEEDWNHLIDADFKSVFFGTQSAVRQMKKNGGGVVLNTSSFTSIVPTAGKALYSAIKSAVNSLTKTFAVEFACENIRVNTVIPGYTVTPLTEKNIEFQKDWLVSTIGLNRLAYPSDMVGAYLFLASDAASYIDGVSLEVAGAKCATQNPHWSWKRPEKFV